MSTPLATSTRAAAGIAVASLHVYPLKGAAGFSPRRWPVDERGLRHDRRFMLVDDSGVFISQRSCPMLACVTAKIEADALRVTCPMGTLDVRLEALDAPALSVRVWDDTLEAIPVSSQADAMLSSFLRHRCRIVWMPSHAARMTAATRGEPRRRVSFADAAPLLLASTAALDDLNARLRRNGAPAVPIDRFRANIVVRGAAVEADDRWSALAINDARFRVTNSCKRCKVITIDQETGEPQGAEPLRTLATYRREGDAVTFGQHLLVDVAGTIAVGDAIKVESSAR